MTVRRASRTVMVGFATLLLTSCAGSDSPQCRGAYHAVAARRLMANPCSALTAKQVRVFRGSSSPRRRLPSQGPSSTGGCTWGAGGKGTLFSKDMISVAFFSPAELSEFLAQNRVSPDVRDPLVQVHGIGDRAYLRYYPSGELGVDGLEVAVLWVRIGPISFRIDRDVLDLHAKTSAELIACAVIDKL